MKNYLKLFSLLVVFSTFLVGCANRKNMIYFQDLPQNVVISDSVNFELKYKVGDFLAIQVSGAEPELLVYFNQERLFGENFTGNYAFDNPQTSGFTVMEDSTINFPLIGKIKAAGKTRIQLTNDLTVLLKKYIDDPVVNIRLRNFKITVLGDVAAPGTFTVTNERISLIEAIGVARDLNITAKRKNVLVIREENGRQITYRIDLTKDDLFNSPVYYLQQNDVVYVEPNQAKLNTSKYSPVYGVLISVTSLIITTVVLITNK
ncbi:MAG: polysaccharide biosynthesis/export family protein [Brumimicrobium sp.]|nr:polysaccharide biosynthesis/export family protein [Brumimicrobium sp.]